MFLFLTIMTRLFVAFLVIVSILPLLSVGAWVVRLCDFPRLQFAIMVMIPASGLVGWYLMKGWSTEQTIHALLCGLILFWQTWHIAKYTVLWQQELPDAHATESDSSNLKVVVINLQFENEHKEEVRNQIKELDVDLLLLIEIDEAWQAALSKIEEDFPYREGVVRGKGLGMMLWSKLPLSDSEVRHLVSEDRASIFATVEYGDSKQINFVGVHPTPPGLEVNRDDDDDSRRHNSRIRDAELMIIAREIAKQQNENWLVTGDFNDVAWSHTTRLFKRISGLKDPRVGRGLFNSYHAQRFWMRCPIDQVFLSPGAEIVKLERFTPVGSDHFAITTIFNARDLKPADPEPVNNDLDDSKEIIQEGQEDAEDVGEKSSEDAP